MKCKYCQYPYDCKYNNKNKNMQLPQNNFEEYYKNISNKITKKQREIKRMEYLKINYVKKKKNFYV